MNNQSRIQVVLLTGLLLAHEAVIAAEIAKHFIACPIYRDTVLARKSGCWLVNDDETGIRYDLQRSHTKPQLGQEVLVEAMLPDVDQTKTGSGTEACGGVVLKTVRVSVLPTSCKPFLIPAEGYAGLNYQVPSTAMTPNYLPQPQPKPPYVTRDFTILFNYNDDYLIYQHAEIILQEAVRLAKVGKAKQIIVTGYASTQPDLASGRSIQENINFAKARALMVNEALTRLGIPKSMITLSWQGDPPADSNASEALKEASKRRVTIQVQI